MIRWPLLSERRWRAIAARDAGRERVTRLGRRSFRRRTSFMRIWGTRALDRGWTALCGRLTPGALNCRRSEEPALGLIALGLRRSEAAAPGSIELGLPMFEGPALGLMASGPVPSWARE